MLLAIDIGNTNTAIGLFENDQLKATWHISSDANKQPDEYAVLLHSLLSYRGFSAQAIRDAVLCSVVPPLTPIFEELCRSYFNIDPLVVGGGVKTGIRILYDNTKEVGADRVAQAVAAYRLYGGPVVVVDFGTATVLDAVSKEGDYLGGAIAPGLGIAAESLYLKTARLPRIELIRPKTAIGRNTVGSMQSGIIFGYVGLVEGLVARFKEEMGGQAKVVATGGLAPVMARETSIFDAVNPNLVLTGLRMIHELNSRPPV